MNSTIRTPIAIRLGAIAGQRHSILFTTAERQMGHG
jgi:hypothetical protein